MTKAPSRRPNALAALAAALALRDALDAVLDARLRGSGRRRCSMADCGTNAKKRRYVARRRERRTRSA